MTDTITLESLTSEQINALRKQMKAQAKAMHAFRKEKRTLVEKMLHEKADDGDGFAHTTLDIWIAVHEKGWEDADPQTKDQADRDRVLKWIQSVKQKLEKAGKDVGYKPTPRVIGALTFDRVHNWVTETELTSEQKANLIALLS